jgi:hypothetical protein
MRTLGCNACSTIYQIGGDLQEVKYLLGTMLPDSETFPCITPLCSGRLVPASVWHSEQPVIEVPIQSFYRAINGFGVGKGSAASLKEAVRLLTTKKIVSVVGESAGQPERVILRQLVLEDGTKLHFDTSSLGACLYYIETKGPSCVEELENDTSNNAASSLGRRPATDREEVGRGDKAFDCGEEIRTGGPSPSAAGSEHPKSSVLTMSKGG